MLYLLQNKIREECSSEWCYIIEEWKCRAGSYRTIIWNISKSRPSSLNEVCQINGFARSIEKKILNVAKTSIVDNKRLYTEDGYRWVVKTKYEPKHFERKVLILYFQYSIVYIDFSDSTIETFQKAFYVRLRTLSI